MASLNAVLADELDESTCRCCFSKEGSKDVDGAYYTSGDKEVYADMLSETFGIKLLLSTEVGSAHSKLICDECVSRLRNAARFRVQILDCEKQFTRLVASKSFESEHYENQQDTSYKQSNLFEEVVMEEDLSTDYQEESMDETTDHLDNISIESDKKNFHVTLNEITMSEEAHDEGADEIEVKEESLWVDVQYKDVSEDTDSGTLGYNRRNIDDETTDEPSANYRAELVSGEKIDHLGPDSSELKNLLLKQTEAAVQRRPEIPKATQSKHTMKFLEDPEVREKFIKAFLAGPKVHNKSKIFSESEPPKEPESGSEKKTERRRVSEGIKKHLRASSFGSKGTVQNAQLIIEHTTAYPFRLLNTLIRCGFCDDTFHTADMWREHVETKHSKCAFGDFVYTRKPFQRIRVDINGLKCRICSAEADDLTGIVKHLTITHNKSFSTKCDLGVMPFKIIHDDMTCLMCGEKHPTLLRLAIHVGSHFEDFLCSTCGKGFSRLQHLSLHKKEHATEFRCTKCEINFETHEELQAHMKMHPLQRHKCSVCGELFNNYLGRLRHMNSVHGHPAPVYNCKVCSIKFDSKSLYLKHNRIHHAPKPFKCEYCGDKFGRQRLLTVHLAKHTGDKKYHCDICGKSLSTRGSLRCHQRIHTNDRRYICQFCEQAFVQGTSLVLHLKNHHRDQMGT